MKLFLKIIYISIANLHKGTLVAKIKSSIVIGFVLSPLTLMEKINLWFSDHALFFLIIFGATVLDMLLGVYIHAFKERNFDGEKLVTGFLTKVFLTFAGLAIYELISAMFHLYNVEIHDYIRLTISLVVLVFPLGSAIGNLSIATNGKYPPKKWITRFNEFQESGDLKETIKNEKL